MSKQTEKSVSSICRLRVTGPTEMYCKLTFAALAVFFGSEFVSASNQHILPTTTAAELWNPWTWFWPYAIATAEGYRDYYQKAQKATNELYIQIEKTNAFPWLTGKKPETNQNDQSNQSGKDNQGGQSNQNQGENNQGEQTKPTENEQTKPNENEQTKPNENEQTKPNENEQTKPDENEQMKPTEDKGEGAPNEAEKNPEENDAA